MEIFCFIIYPLREFVSSFLLLFVRIPHELSVCVQTAGISDSNKIFRGSHSLYILFLASVQM